MSSIALPAFLLIGCFFNLNGQNCYIPTNVVSNNITPTTATLNWDAMPNATAYEVNYRPMNAPSTQPWNTVAAPTNTVTVNALTPSTMYDVQVRSACGSTFSDYTVTTSFSTQNCVPPINPSVNNLTANTADVQWTAVPGASGYQLLYRIAVSDGTPDPWTTVSSVNNAYNLTGLTANTLYAGRLVTDCGGFLSDHSKDFYFSTNPCSVPSNLMITAQTASSISLSWNAVPSANQYNVQYRTAGNGTWSTVNTNTNSRTINGLTGNTAYEFRVRSNCGGGVTSAYTLITKGFTLPCAMPENAVISNVTVNSATVSWNNATGANQYRVEYREALAPTWTTINANNTTKTITGLTPNTDYEARVRTKCTGNQYSAYTETLTFQTKSCAVPQGFAVTQTSYTYVDLRWNSIPNAQNYNIQYQIVGDTTWTSANENDTLRRVNNLTPNTAYNFRVRAKCANNTFSDFSNTQTITTLHCAPPAEVLAGHIDDDSELISWSQVPGALNYQLSYKQVNDTAWIQVNVNPLSRQINNLNLTGTYIVRLRSKCANGVFSDWSSPIYFYKNGCATPVNPTITYNNNQTFNVQFAPSPNTTAYGLNYRIPGNHTWINQTSNSPNFTIRHWNLCTTYEYRVTRSCTSGVVSDYSTVHQYTTPADNFCNDHPPVGVADYRILPMNQMTVVNVFSNDRDPDGDSLYFDPANPPLMVQGDGHMSIIGNNIRFIPNWGFMGYATVEYTPFAGNRRGLKTLLTLKYENIETFGEPSGCTCNLVPNGDFEEGELPDLSPNLLGSSVSEPIDNQYLSCWSNFSGAPKVLDRGYIGSQNDLYAGFSIPFDNCSNQSLSGIQTYDELETNRRMIALRAGGAGGVNTHHPEASTRDRILTRLKQPIQPGQTYNLSLHLTSVNYDCVDYPLTALEIYAVEIIPPYQSGMELDDLFQMMLDQNNITQLVHVRKAQYYDQIGWEHFEATFIANQISRETPFLLIRAVPEGQALPPPVDPNPVYSSWIILDDLCITPVGACPSNSVTVTKTQVQNNNPNQLTFRVTLTNTGNLSANNFFLTDAITSNVPIAYIQGNNPNVIITQQQNNTLSINIPGSLAPQSSTSFDLVYNLQSNNGVFCGNNQIQLDSYNSLPAHCLQNENLSAAVNFQSGTTITLTTSLPQSVCQNNVNTFTLTASPGYDNYTFFTESSWATIVQANPADNFAQVTITGDVSIGSANFSVSVVSGTCQFQPVTTTVTINRSPVINTLSTVNGCLGSPLQLSATEENAVPNPTFTWTTPTNTTLTGANVVIDPATPDNAGTYLLTVTGSEGCTATASVTVTLTGLQPAITAQPTSVCSGENTVLTVNPQPPTATYLWSTGETTPSITTSNLNANTSYSVTLTQGNCTGSANITVAVNPIPDLTTFNSTPLTICQNSLVFRELPNNSNIRYTVAPPNQNVFIMGNVPLFRVAFLGQIPGAQTYTITATHRTTGCSTAVNIPVTVRPESVINITAAATTICAGQSVRLTAALPGATNFRWSLGTNPQNSNVTLVNPQTSTRYLVSAIDANGCNATGSIVITVNPNPSIRIAPTNPTICQGGTGTTLRATGAVTYQWNPVTGLSNPNIANPVANPTQATNYTVVGTDANGCTGIATVTVGVNVPPTPQILTQNICQGSEIITINPGTNQPFTVTWIMTNPGNTAFMLQPNQSGIVDGTVIRLVNNGNLTFQQFRVTVTTAAGCSTTINGQITINPTPQFTQLPPNNQLYCSGGMGVVLSATGTGTITWFEGNNTIPLVGNPITVTPAQTTIYTVRLSSLNGCATSSQCTVTVAPSTIINYTEQQLSICDRFNRRRVCVNNPEQGTTYTWNSISPNTSILPEDANGQCVTVLTLDPAVTTRVNVTSLQNDPCPQVITLQPEFTQQRDLTAISTTELATLIGISPNNDGVYTLDGNINNLRTLSINTFTVDAPLVLKNVNVVAATTFSIINMANPLTLENCYIHAPLSFSQLPNNRGTIGTFFWRGIQETFNNGSPEQRLTLINSKLEHAVKGIQSHTDLQNASRLTIASINSCFNQNENHIFINIDGTSITANDPVNTLSNNSPLVIRGSRFDCNAPLTNGRLSSQTGISVFCRQLSEGVIQNIDIGHPDQNNSWVSSRNTFTRMNTGVSITNPSMSMGNIRINNNDFINLVTPSSPIGANSAGILMLGTNETEDANQFYNLQVGGLAGTGNRTDNTFFNMDDGISMRGINILQDPMPRGNLTIAQNSFGNLALRGIHISSSPDNDNTVSTLTIESNNIGTIGIPDSPVRSGIVISQLQQMSQTTIPPLVIIRDNQIAYTVHGVQLDATSTIVPRLQVLDNHDIMYVQQSISSTVNQGVFYKVTNLVPTNNQPIAQIRGNNIRSRDPMNYAIKSGIHVLCNALAPLTFDIEDNFIDNVGDPLLGNIFYDDVSPPEMLPMSRGIEFSFTGSQPNQLFNIRNNLIRGSDLPNTFGTGIELINTNSALLECNRIANASIGIRAHMDCDPCTLYTNVVRNPSYAGLALTLNGIIGLQGDPNGDSYGNAWTYAPNTTYGTASIASTGNASRIIDNGVTFAPGYTDNPHSVASIGFPSNVTNRMFPNQQPGTPRPADCHNNEQNLAWPQVINQESPADYWLKWLQPEPQYAVFDEEAKYMHGLKLLRKLEDDIAFRNSDSRLDSFYLTKTQKNEKRLLMIENAIRDGKFELALAINQGLNPVNAIEETHQKVNSVYLQNNLRSKQPSSASSPEQLFTAEEWQIILQTSVLCPEKYGAGVYQARILRAIQENGSRHYNSNCLPVLTRSDVQSKAVTAERGNFSLYPNPATESLIFRYNTDRDIQVILSDVTGRKMTESSLSHQGTHTFDVSELPAGVYIIRAFSENQTLFTEKVVVIKP